MPANLTGHRPPPADSPSRESSASGVNFLRRELEANLKLEVGKHAAKAKCVEIGERDMAAAAAAHGRHLRSQHVDPVLPRLLDLNTQKRLQDSRLFVLRSSETTHLFMEDSHFTSHIHTLR